MICGKEKKALTFDNANSVAILIRPPVLLGVANTAHDPDVFHPTRCKLMVVSSHWCWVLCHGWVSRVNNNKHCLLSAYAGPEAVLFHLRPLDLSLHPSDEIATMVTIPILQMRKLKPRKLQQPRVAQLVVETLTQVCVTPASPHLPTGPYCFPRCYSLGTDKVNKQEHWALALALSLCVTSCVTSPGLNLPVYGMGM